MSSPKAGQNQEVKQIINQIPLPQISERVPAEKNRSPQAVKIMNSNGTMLDHETSFQSAQVVKKQETITLQQKKFNIPRLALQNI